MKVGFVTGEYPPRQGGVGAFTREVARAMAAQGHAVYVLTRPESAGMSEPGIEVTAVSSTCWRWQHNMDARQWAHSRQLEVINLQFQTAAYDMHPGVHWLPDAVREIPVVVTFHDLRVPYLFPKAGPVRTWSVRRLARHAAGAVATDRADERILRDQWGVRAVRWIPIGSNITVSLPGGFSAGEWRRQRGIPPDSLLVAYFGFLNESKGGLDLMDALARLHHNGVAAHAIMIGGRAGSSDVTNLDYGKQVDASIEAHGLTEYIHWTGFVSDPEVSAAFCAADMVVLPYRDGVSLRRGTLMAALAHGRPIVTTHPGTRAPELDGAVLTVPPAAPDPLAEAILRLWRDAALRDSLAAGARAASVHFSWDNIAASTIDFCRSLLNR